MTYNPQPGEPAPDGQSYIAASYVKWLESAGARVVPILYDMTKEQILRRYEVGQVSDSGVPKRHSFAAQHETIRFHVLRCIPLSAGAPRWGGANTATFAAGPMSAYCRRPTARFAIINGLLLPGGGATLAPGHRFYDTAQQLVELALAANDKGDYFPVGGEVLRSG